MSALQRIFEPIQIGRVTIPNRVVRTAHGTSMSHPGINEDLIADHVACAACATSRRSGFRAAIDDGHLAARGIP